MKDNNRKILQLVRYAFSLVGLLLVVSFLLPFHKQILESYQSIMYYEAPVATKQTVLEVAKSAIINGIDVETGLIAAEGFEVVKINCTRCHSAQLVVQNKGSREHWKEMIRWMQKTQGLWDLGANEVIILDYLEKNYASENVGRRAPLKVKEWYMLEN